MRASKSIGSLNGPNGQQVAVNNLFHHDTNGYNQHLAQPPQQTSSSVRNNSILSENSKSNNLSSTSPICRCRVMYLGSSVPHITKDGLQGIQQPLHELYPDKITLASGNAGIDSWLSVWSNGILVENVDETGKEIKRFFKIESLHYCAAVKYVPSTQNHTSSNSAYESLSNLNPPNLPQFLPLDSPFARQSNLNPPIFASILRRTTGIKVLECHAFICKREAAANALVRCCFHAYADTMYAKQIDANMSSHNISNDVNNNIDRATLNTKNYIHQSNIKDDNPLPMAKARSKSIANLNETELHQQQQQARGSNHDANYSDYPQESSRHNESSSITRQKSMNELQAIKNFGSSKNSLVLDKKILKNQSKLSKSMHHINQIESMNLHQLNQCDVFDSYSLHQQPVALSANGHPNHRIGMHHMPPQPFYNPNASRVPSYPPPNLIDAPSHGGTLKSIKSMAANSIASTLLRSKKHAKAMSIAQLNHANQITSFHQPLQSNASTMIGPVMLPPISPLFLPNISPRILNGSQTMKNPCRSAVPFIGPPMNFETMTHKEMKKLLKESARYGLDPVKFGDNGLPIMPLRMPPPPPIPPHSDTGNYLVPPPMFPPDMYAEDVPDVGLPMVRMPLPEPFEQPQVKPILVRPNPDFIKSKAGKKWLKQQKEFKKLLPPHLDGLPIVFGPPPMDALEPAVVPKNNIQPPAFMPPPPIPMMDGSGYYNPHPFYGQNASTTSTLVRYSPHSQMIKDAVNGGMIGNHHNDMGFNHKSHSIYNTPISGGAPSIISKSTGYIVPDSRSLYGASGCSENGFRSHQHKRNHMVEQSVISLEDENDYEDEEDEQQSDDRFSSIQTKQDYITSKSNRYVKPNKPSGNHSTANNYHEPGIYASSQTYEQVASSTDDQSSYCSGIYKREHINERAFLHSIKQEHKSSSNLTNGDYVAREEVDSNYDKNSQTHYTSQQTVLKGQTFPEDEISRQMQMHELTNRMENQLIMKSFPNSKVKSQM